ncbi:hypothetical protein SLEP1_g56156 [Rubroshorea leprosula]|uniref:Uncharacterized protein n=1 Tax=Rubroshorea leprosula TaxID=152421 RepID=A0AAV5MKU3_9ROSI|nr:hypothetical protein SLEP1_g56156 [Rubroshorea leprosula]
MNKIMPRSALKMYTDGGLGLCISGGVSGNMNRSFRSLPANPFECIFNRFFGLVSRAVLWSILDSLMAFSFWGRCTAVTGSLTSRACKMNSCFIK